MSCSFASENMPNQVFKGHLSPPQSRGDASRRTRVECLHDTQDHFSENHLAVEDTSDHKNAYANSWA